MKIAVGCDRRGYTAKRKLTAALREMSHEVEDFGCGETAPADYPDIAIPAAQAVSKGICDMGILLSGGGIGMSVAANKVLGVRAALVHDGMTAQQAREHYHCNILCLGSDLLSEEQVRDMVEIFLSTPVGKGRHARRVEKLIRFENGDKPRPK
jgi:ribose 5-phosphate isomerase B